MVVDSVEVEIRAGAGGDGIIAWRREKHVPKGGPDGGDGGRGGSVFVKASHDLDTLRSFQFRKVFQAEGGTRGSNKRRHGVSGQDLELLVPVGTRIEDAETGQLLADFTKNEQKIKLVQGGKGGQGNCHFATSTKQVPYKATQGRPGEKKRVRLELQHLADVALVGLPNAGKSSLIRALTDAKSPVGAYAFSTREPILGVMKVGDSQVTIIDLPGLIEGAHKGRGLGDSFLRHTGRVRLLIQVVDGTTDDIARALQAVRLELVAYKPQLKDIDELVVINKIDLLTAEQEAKLKKSFPDAFLVSAELKTGIQDLQSKLANMTLDKSR